MPSPESQKVEELTADQIKTGWHDTFSTSNPFCPCDLKSFTKAVRWAERALATRLATPSLSRGPSLQAAPMSSYPQPDQDFYAFWYSHLVDDVISGPVCGVSYSSARYIWNAARAAAPGESSLAAPAKPAGVQMAITALDEKAQMNDYAIWSATRESFKWHTLDQHARLNFFAGYRAALSALRLQSVGASGPLGDPDVLAAPAASPATPADALLEKARKGEKAAFERYAEQMGLRDFEENESGYRNPGVSGPRAFWAAALDFCSAHLFSASDKRIGPCPELNMSNYNADDVSALNEWAILADALLSARASALSIGGELHPDMRKAVAHLSGAPSSAAGSQG